MHLIIKTTRYSFDFLLFFRAILMSQKKITLDSKATVERWKNSEKLRNNREVTK